MQHLDPHQRPPDGIRNIYKKYQKMKLKELDQDQEIIDLSSDASAQSNSKVHVVKEWKGNDLTASFRSFAGQDEDLQDLNVPESVSAYEHEHMPGLYIVPTLLPPEIQSILLSRLLHRDLSNPAHLTNIHTHYTLSYPPPTTSFFSLAPDSPHPVAAPLDPSVHRPLTVAQLLGKKMRWIESIFTSTKAEAAIVNLYSPGDTLSVHRDVAETSSTGLISISLGCDAVFVIGTDDTALTLRLRSGSAVYMSGASRFAWHGVPQIVPGTCPEYLQQWPGIAHGHEGYEAWKGWMASKRVNLNVRQMWD